MYSFAPIDTLRSPSDSLWLSVSFHSALLPMGSGFTARKCINDLHAARALAAAKISP